MNSFVVEVVPYLDDNFAYLIHHLESRATVLIDCGDAAPVVARLSEKKWQLDAILLTHFHHDHSGDAPKIAKLFPNSRIYFPYGEDRLKMKGEEIKGGKRWKVKGMAIEAVDLSAHTLPCFGYLIGQSLFVGDVLFSAGCGRLFEGTAADMEKAMDRLRQFPKATKIYFGHEYTLANLEFAQSVEPENAAIRDYYTYCRKLQQESLFTTPSTLGQELEINPFLRIDQEDVIQYVDPKGQYSRTERMGLLRKAKDRF